jgi:hypothetical protein
VTLSRANLPPAWPLRCRSRRLQPALRQLCAGLPTAHLRVEKFGFEARPFGFPDPHRALQMGSFLALSGTNFHAGLNKLGFVLQKHFFSQPILLWCRRPWRDAVPRTYQRLYNCRAACLVRRAYAAVLNLGGRVCRWPDRLRPKRRPYRLPQPQGSGAAPVSFAESPTGRRDTILTQRSTPRTGLSASSTVIP